MCWRLRISVAKRSSEPPTIAIAVRSAAWRSRWTIWVLTGSACRPSVGEHLRLDVRAEVAVRPDRPRDLAGADLVDGGREARPAAVELERPAGELEPERGRLGVDRVGPAHHHGLGLGPGAGDERGEQAVAVREQELAGGAQLEREPGVDDVAAGQAEVEIAALGPDGLGDLADEGDDVVVGRPLDLGDPLDVDARARLDRGEGLGRDQPARRLGAGDGELDAEHLLEAGLRPSRSRPSRGACSARIIGRAPAGSATRRSRADVVAALEAVERRSRRRPRSARLAAASRSGPRPTTVRIRPPAVRHVPSASRAVPAWNTSAPVAAASSRPSIGSPRRGASG